MIYLKESCRQSRRLKVNKKLFEDRYYVHVSNFIHLPPAKKLKGREKKKAGAVLGWMAQWCSAVLREFLVPFIFVKQSFHYVTNGNVLLKFLHLGMHSLMVRCGHFRPVCHHALPKASWRERGQESWLLMLLRFGLHGSVTA